MNISKYRRDRRNAKHKSIRKKISGSENCPRISVRRTLNHFIAQAINDVESKSIFQVHSKSLKLDGDKCEVAKKTGEFVASKLTELGIKTVVFDRSGYIYHGRVKSFAEALRKSDIKF